MESIEIATLKTGQTFTLEFGNKEAIMTKLDEPKKFNVEDWFEEEGEVYLIEDVIEEDEPLHYSLEPLTGDPKALIEKDKAIFGAKKKVWDFLGRTVDGIEMEEEEG
ncbi:MAG: hypothetical protein HQL54_06385 [Magnetococcales bacterium]|nr:hypothetical protein [Magnetococcales bacterium]